MFREREFMAPLMLSKCQNCFADPKRVSSSNYHFAADLEQLILMMLTMCENSIGIRYQVNKSGSSLPEKVKLELYCKCIS